MANLPTTATVTDPGALGYDAALGTLLLRLARRPQDPALLETAEAGAQRVQSERTAEDFLPAVGDIFSRNDFRGGQGLDFAYKADGDPGDTRRYWRASAIEPVNVTGAPERIELARDTEGFWPTSHIAHSLVYAAQEEIIWAEVNSSTLWVVDDPLGASPTRVAEDPHTGTAVLPGSQPIIAVLGDEVFVACRGDGVGKRNSAGVWSDLAVATSGTNWESLWAGKGRLFAEVQRPSGTWQLVEVDPSTGDEIVLLTLPGGNYGRVTAVTEAGPVILVGTQVRVTYSNKYYEPGPVFVFGEDAGQLVILAQFSMPATEVVHQVAYLAGKLLIVTSEVGAPVGGIRKCRVWTGTLGQAGAGYVPTDLELRHEISQIQNHGRNMSVATGRNRIYYAFGAPASDQLGEGTQVWYYDVTQDSLVHAATHTTSPTPNIPAGIGVLANNRYWIASYPYGVQRNLDTAVASGWLISPAADFFNPADKAWLDVTIEGDAGDGTVAVYVSNDIAALEDYQHSSWQLVGTIPTNASMGTPITLDLITNLTGRYGAVQLRMTKGTTTDPIVYSFALRARSKNEDYVLTLPVNVSDQIERALRRPVRVPGWGERVLAAIRAKVGDFLTVEIYRPSLTMEGVVQRVSEPYVGRTSRGSLSLTCDVEIRGRLV